jgi:hypothetical protein
VFQPLYVPLVRKFKKRVEVSPPLASILGPDPPSVERVSELAVATSGEAADLALDSDITREKAVTPPADNAGSTCGAGDPSDPVLTSGKENQRAKGDRRKSVHPNASSAQKQGKKSQTGAMLNQ